MLWILTMNIIFLMSMMIILVNHPMTMGFTLLFQTTMIALMTSMMGSTSWFSYILFLIMVSGMLVLFIYMTSIASNEKFKFSNSWMLITVPIIASTIYMISDKLMTNYNMFKYEQIQNIPFENTLTKFMNFPFNYLMIMLIVYLFFTLIAVVKISMIKYGPLRQLN
uniref:NADH-ubiquinone oxidoreductase chain 6 n=1 Tax=Berosus affinis TaxID=877818 RepID=A0A191ZR62_9COLE|nr:NADH dehydrogenase subunit 6 [Berosus affinis]